MDRAPLSAFLLRGKGSQLISARMSAISRSQTAETETRQDSDSRQDTLLLSICLVLMEMLWNSGVVWCILYRVCY